MLALKCLENFCWNFMYVISMRIEVGMHSHFLMMKIYISYLQIQIWCEMWCNNSEQRNCVLEIYLLWSNLLF